MSDQGIVILGIVIPSSSKAFLTIVAVHVAAGLVCVLAGAVAMLSPKRTGRHPTAGTLYYWSLVVVSLSMTALLSVARHDAGDSKGGSAFTWSGWASPPCRPSRTGWVPAWWGFRFWCARC